MTDLARLVPEQFDALLGQTFAVNDQDGVLELLEVLRLKSPSARAQPFSLLFTSRTHQLTQATFRIAHPAIGAFDLFLVPIQPDARGALYEAVFN
jgi:hypothetical protein